MRLLVEQAFWLALPVIFTGILHMVVVKRDLFARMCVPLDGGRTLGGVRIFGPNKTWRGALFMPVCAAVLGVLQGALGGGWAERGGTASFDYLRATGFQESSLLSYALAYAWVNALLGLGYVLGELPNSFLKRRVGIAPGKTQGGAWGALFFVVDQSDSVVFSLVLGALLFSYGWPLVVVGAVCLTLLHLGVNAVLYGVRIRRNL
jgi:CDP-diglyceride synthetase